MAQVIEHERKAWKIAALSAIVELAKRHETFTADEVREACVELGPPHHCNVWGALMNKAAKAGVIRRTDRLRVSTRPEAHGHLNPIWESCLYPRLVR